MIVALAILVHVVCYLCMAEVYHWVWGHRLRWRYVWAAFGLNLMKRRAPGWEVK